MRLNRPLRRPRALLCGFVLVAFSSGPTRAQPPDPLPALEFSENSVSVRSASSGGRLVLFGFAHDEQQYVMTLRRWEEILENSDQSGTFTFDLGRSVPPASIWVAVDLQTGESAVVTPGGLPPRQLVVAAQAIAPRLQALDVDVPMLDVLLVRPGVGATAVGAWGLRVGDGGASDEDDAQDGTLRAALDGMWSVADSAAPPLELLEGDVLVLVDTLNLRIVVLRLAAGGGIPQW